MLTKEVPSPCHFFHDILYTVQGMDTGLRKLANAIKEVPSPCRFFYDILCTVPGMDTFMNSKIINILTQYPDMKKLNCRAVQLKELSDKVAVAEDREHKLELLEQYIREFNSFLGECVDFYNDSISNINNYMSKTISDKDDTIKNLQEAVGNLTTQLVEEQYKHEQFLDTLCSLARTEPEKALGFLNNLGAEKSRQKDMLC